MINHGFSKRHRDQLVRKREAKRAKEKLRIERKRVYEKVIEGYFDRFDENKNNLLDHKEMVHMFEQINLINLSSEARENKDKYENAKTIIDFMKKHLPHPAELTKEEVIEVVSKYYMYLKQKTYLDKLMDKYDVIDKNGVLSPDELLRLLQEDHQSRLVLHLDHIGVDLSDSNLVIELCDLDQDGNISRDELLCAIAEWHLVLDSKVEKKYTNSKSGMCNLF